jgi:hypothetical protein
MTGAAPERGSALVVAVLAVALAGLMAAAFAQLGRTALIRAQLDHAGVRAWFLAEAGLADTFAALEPGGSFDTELAAPAVAASGPWTYEAVFTDDEDEAPADPEHDANQRVLVRITSFGPPPVRRALEAVIGREPRPFLPAAATLAGGVRDLTTDFSLDGRDYDVSSGCAVGSGMAPRAGLALPEDLPLPSSYAPAQIAGEGDAPSIRRSVAPDLTPIAGDASAERHTAGALAGVLGSLSTPRFVVVEGDALVDGAAVGAGMLYVAGRLSVRGTFAFTGVVAAEEGVEVTSGASLDVCGALWAAGDPALDVRGAGAVRASTDAIALADRLAPLPARAAIMATKELLAGDGGTNG